MQRTERDSDRREEENGEKEEGRARPVTCNGRMVNDTHSARGRAGCLRVGQQRLPARRLPVCWPGSVPSNVHSHLGISKMHLSAWSVEAHL